MTQKRFPNQTVIVTGAGEGIGYEVARHFCAEGASVILNDILPDRAMQPPKASPPRPGPSASPRRAMSPISSWFAAW